MHKMTNNNLITPQEYKITWMTSLGVIIAAVSLKLMKNSAHKLSIMGRIS